MLPPHTDDAHSLTYTLAKISNLVLQIRTIMEAMIHWSFEGLCFLQFTEMKYGVCFGSSDVQMKIYPPSFKSYLLSLFGSLIKSPLASEFTKRQLRFCFMWWPCESKHFRKRTNSPPKKNIPKRTTTFWKTQHATKHTSILENATTIF